MLIVELVMKKTCVTVQKCATACIIYKVPTQINEFRFVLVMKKIVLALAKLYKNIVPQYILFYIKLPTTQRKESRTFKSPFHYPSITIT